MRGVDDAVITPLASLAAQRERRARRQPITGMPRLSDRLLHRVALAVNSTLELREVLTELADVTLEATGADRCSIFLLDGHVVSPAVALGARPDEDLWASFRALGPVDLRRFPSGERLLAAGRAVGVVDAGAVDFIPAEWVAAFGLRSVVVVPLLAEGRPCGLLALDYQDPHELGVDESVLLESIAAHAGLAVRNARLFEATRRRAVLQQVLAGSAATLALPLDPAAIAQHVVRACATIFDPGLCLIALFDAARTRLTVLADSTPEGRTGVPTVDLAVHVRDRLGAEWESALRPVWFGPDPWFAELAATGTRSPARHLVVPLATAGQARGVLVLGFPESRLPDGDQFGAAEALATVAAAALERAGLRRRADRAVRRVGLLAEVALAIGDPTGPAALVSRLGELLAGDPVEVVAVTLRDRTLARRLGWEVAAPPAVEGDAAVPLRLGRRTLGSLHVRGAAMEPEDHAFAQALARGVAQALARAASAAELGAATCELAEAADRARLTAELHETVGELLVGIGLLAHGAADDLPQDSPWAQRISRLGEIARDGKWTLDQAGRALAYLPGSRRSLPSALRSLARSIEADSGITVAVTVRGRPVPSTEVDRALYRVAHEALVGAWRHANCSLVTLVLDYDADAGPALRVRDDGVPLERRTGERDAWIGLSNMRRAVAGAGGTVRASNAKPRGVLVEAKAGRRR